GLRMEPVALLERPAQASGKRLRHRAFPRTRDAHHDQHRRAAMMSMRAFQAMYAGVVGEEHQAGPADDQTDLNDSNDRSDPLIEACGIGDLAEIAVEDVIAAVRDQRNAAWHLTKTRVRAKRLKRRLCRLEPERNDLYRHRSVSTEAVHQLGL